MSSLHQNPALDKIEISKILSSLLNEPTTNFINEKTYQNLINVFELPNTEASIEDVCGLLLAESSKERNWEGALRSLMVIHKMIHKLGSKGLRPTIFANTRDLNHFSALKPTDSSAVTLLHCPHVGYYLNYLQRLSYSYDDFHLCFFPSKALPESFVHDGLSFLNFLHSLQNLQGSLLGVIPSLEVSFIKFPHLNLVKQLAYFYLMDCFYIYSYLTQAINALLTTVLKLPFEDQLTLYEIYTTQIEMTQKAKESFGLAKYLEEFDIKTPTYFQPNAKFLTEFLKSISHLKRVDDSQELTQIQEESDQSPEKSFSTNENIQEPISLVNNQDEIVKIVETFVHVNQDFDPNFENCLFKSPNPAKKRPQGPLSIPKIKITKVDNKIPAGKEAERTINLGMNFLQIPEPRPFPKNPNPGNEGKVMGDESFYPE